MQPHQQRVLDEKADLDNKLGKLFKFSLTPEFDALDDDEQRRLVEQSAAMCAYNHALAARINAFAPDLGVTPYDVIIIPTRPR